MRNSNLIIIGALILLLSGGYVVYSGARGLRNNNPLNMEDDGTDWEGLDTPRNDGEAPNPMLRFQTPEYGLRAARISLLNAIAHDGVPCTVDGLIRHWSATDQDAYVAHVAGFIFGAATARLFEGRQRLELR